MALSRNREGLVDGLRSHIAYAARYGRQSVEVIERRSVRWLLEFNKDVSDIIIEENTQKEE